MAYLLFFVYLMIDLSVVSGIWVFFRNSMGMTEFGIHLGEYRSPPLLQLSLRIILAVKKMES